MTDEPASFSFSVDRFDDGPIVISVRGALACPFDARLLVDCLTSVAVVEQPVVVDLGEVPSIDHAASELVVDATQRLSRSGCAVTVVAPAAVDDRERRGPSRHVVVDPAHDLGATTRSQVRTTAVDALHGTYL